MNPYKSQQTIAQLEKRKGGYFYIKIDAELIQQYPDKRLTRFICTIENHLNFQCGLNHLGDGNYFIILSKKNLDGVKKQLGDTISFELNVDPNPLGVDLPEVLETVLDQDDNLKTNYDNLTIGKKRNIIHQINRIKDIDKQVQKIIQLVNEDNKPRSKKVF